MHRGPPRGAKYCDFVEILHFLRVVKKKQPVTVYGLYHQWLWKTDIRKVYRYLRYAVKVNLVILDHIDDTKGGLPAKYHRLTTAGEDLVKWAAEHIPNVIFGS